MRFMLIRKEGTRLAAAALAVAVIATVGIWLLAPTPDDEDNIITLGTALSFSGKYSASGNNTFNGYELAIKRINEAGGVQVSGEKYTLKIASYDDKSDPLRATELVERFITVDGIQLMLGPYSSELTKAVAEVTKFHKIPLVEAEGAALDLFDRGDRYIFGLLSTCEQYLRPVINLAAERARQSGRNPADLKVAIAVQNERFSLCVRDAVVQDIKEHGMKLIIDEKLPSVIQDMSEVLYKVRAKKPDVFLVSGHSFGAKVAARLMEKMQIHVPITAVTHCEAAQLAEKFPAAAEGIYCPAQWAPSLPYRGELFGSAMDFANAMKATYPERRYVNVPYQAASAAAAVMVWKDALERANSFDTERLRDALAETDLMTFYGRIKFAPTGQIDSKPMVLRQIQNGQYVVIP